MFLYSQFHGEVFLFQGHFITVDFFGWKRCTGMKSVKIVEHGMQEQFPVSESDKKRKEDP